MPPRPANELMSSTSDVRPRPSSRRLRLPAAACAVILLAAGCGGYRLGPTGGQVAGARSIQVTPFANDTLEPRVGDAVTAALRKSLQHDSTFRLATRPGADVIVTGTITRFERSDMSYNPNDVLTPLDYRVSVMAHVTARERSTGKTLLDRDVSGYTLVRPGADLPGAERQALPLIAEDLAKNVTALLVDGAW